MAGVTVAFIKKADQTCYFCVPFAINAAYYRTLQKWERVFFIGIRREYDFTDKLQNLIAVQRRKVMVTRELFKELSSDWGDKNHKTCNAKITYVIMSAMRWIPYDCFIFNGIGYPIDTMATLKI